MLRQFLDELMANIVIKTAKAYGMTPAELEKKLQEDDEKQEIETKPEYYDTQYMNGGKIG